MAKIHITGVGGQPDPVYHGIVATKPGCGGCVKKGNVKLVITE